MSPQIAPYRGCIIALAAFVWLFSAVYFQMCPWMACMWGGKVTLIAFVWLFSALHFQMFPQMACLWARSHIYHLSIPETTFVILVCVFQDSMFSQIFSTQVTYFQRYIWIFRLLSSDKNVQKIHHVKILCITRFQVFHSYLPHKSHAFSYTYIMWNFIFLLSDKNIPQIHHVKTKKMLKRSRMNGLNWGSDKWILQIRWGCCNWSQFCHWSHFPFLGYKILRIR